MARVYNCTLMGITADACDSREFEVEITNGVPRLLKERHDEGAATHAHSAGKYLKLGTSRHTGSSPRVEVCHALEPAHLALELDRRCRQGSLGHFQQAVRESQTIDHQEGTVTYHDSVGVDGSRDTLEVHLARDWVDRDVPNFDLEILACFIESSVR